MGCYFKIIYGYLYENRRIQGVNSAPITIYAIVVVSIIMIVILLLSMVQCFRFVQSLQDKM